MSFQFFDLVKDNLAISDAIMAHTKCPSSRYFVLNVASDLSNPYADVEYPLYYEIVMKSDLEKLSDMIKEQRDSGKIAIVHCIGGEERSPLVVAYHMVKTKEAKDLEEAYSSIE